jgi:hypothetical protein
MLTVGATLVLACVATIFDVFVTIDPTNLANDTGTLTIHENFAGNGGTFGSNLNVYYDAHFMLTEGSSAFDVFNNTHLSESGAQWGSTPPLGAVIVNGIDNNIEEDEPRLAASGFLHLRQEY